MTNNVVYLVCLIKDVDPYELPVAILPNQTTVAKFLGVTRSYISKMFRNGVTISTYDRWQIEKVIL